MSHDITKTLFKAEVNFEEPESNLSSTNTS